VAPIATDGPGISGLDDLTPVLALSAEPAQHLLRL
jgi:hypothetical protein